MVNHCRLDCCNSTAAGNSEFKGSFNLTTVLAGNDNKQDCEHSGKTIVVKVFVTFQINTIKVCIIFVFTTEEFSDNHDLLVMKKKKKKKTRNKQKKQYQYMTKTSSSQQCYETVARANHFNLLQMKCSQS